MQAASVCVYDERRFLVERTDVDARRALLP
jgi:hypothetical protein